MEYIFYIIAGVGAGAITGLAGLTAALIITPILFAICGWDAFDSVTVALLADVPASFMSAVTYYKNNNVDIKRGGAVAITAFLGSVIGTYCGFLFNQAQPGGLGYLSLISTIVFGVRFIISPITGGQTEQTNIDTPDEKRRIILAMFLGTFIGWICGFCGSGGGMLMLSLFVLLLRMSLKTSVGTSTMVMTAVALTGAVSHFMMGASLNILPTIVIVGSCLISSVSASKFANKCEAKVLNRVIGGVLIWLGIITWIFKII